MPGRLWHFELQREFEQGHTHSQVQLYRGQKRSPEKEDHCGKVNSNPTVSIATHLIHFSITYVLHGVAIRTSQLKVREGFKFSSVSFFSKAENTTSIPHSYLTSSTETAVICLCTSVLTDWLHSPNFPWLHHLWNPCPWLVPSHDTMCYRQVPLSMKAPIDSSERSPGQTSLTLNCIRTQLQFPALQQFKVLADLTTQEPHVKMLWPYFPCCTCVYVFNLHTSNKASKHELLIALQGDCLVLFKFGHFRIFFEKYSIIYMHHIRRTDNSFLQV